MNNYLDNIEDKEAFQQSVKDRLDQVAFQRLDQLKTEMANEFLTSEEEE